MQQYEKDHLTHVVDNAAECTVLLKSNDSYGRHVGSMKFDTILTRNREFSSFTISLACYNAYNIKFVIL
jgi:hypothetical protein